MSNKEVFVNVNINFWNHGEIINVVKCCGNKNIADVINDIRQRYNIKKEMYECIKIEIGCDKGNNSFIDFNVHHSQYLSDKAKIEIMEIIKSIEDQLLEKLQKDEKA
jgi:hypothetical protein